MAGSLNKVMLIGNVGADDDLGHPRRHRLKHGSLILPGQLGVKRNEAILATPELWMLL